MGMAKPFVAKLEQLLGKEKVLSTDADLLCYSYDAAPLVSRRPDAVVRVSFEEGLRAVIEFAASEGLPVTPRGSRSGLSGGSVAVDGGIVPCPDSHNSWYKTGGRSVLCLQAVFKET